MNDPTDKSSFNQGYLEILRLHRLWQQAAILANNSDYFCWNRILDCCWRELASDAQILSKGNIRNSHYFREINRLNQEFNKTWKWTDHEKNEYIWLSKGKAYEILQDKEFTIRALQTECGKGAKYENADTNRMT